MTTAIILTANAGMSRSVALKVTLMHLQTIRKLRISYSLILEKVHFMIHKIWQAKHTHKYHRKSCDIWPGRNREPNHLQHLALTLGIFPHTLANRVQSTFTYNAQQTINWLVHNIQEIISYSVLHTGIILRLEAKKNLE
jgi:hypothetical protein